MVGGPAAGSPAAARAKDQAAVGVTAEGGPQPAFYAYQAPGGAATAGQKVIALTFDDGPGPFTPQVLSVLDHYGVPASFFEIGDQILQYPQYTKLLAAAGYPVEDHTWSHPNLTTIQVSQYPYQIDQTQSEILSLTGQAPACVRPPYDAWSSTVLDQIGQRDLTTMSYSIDPEDWSLPGSQTIVNRVVSAAFPGAVVDLHDGGGPRSQTVSALPQIITDLESRGYRFVSICGSVSQSARQQSAVYSFGDESAAGSSVASDHPLVGAAATPTGGGYWLVAADGGIFAFGDARFYGSTGNMRLNQQIVGMAPTPTGGGYWLVAADGGVFTFGNAGFYGSRSGQNTTDRFFAIISSASGHGYLLAGQHPSS